MAQDRVLKSQRATVMPPGEAVPHTPEGRCSPEAVPGASEVDLLEALAHVVVQHVAEETLDEEVPEAAYIPASDLG